MKKPAPTKPIDATVQRRLDALERLIDSDYEGSAKVFEQRTGIKMAQVGQWFTGYRALRDKALRRLEAKTRKPQGFFDGDTTSQAQKRGDVFQSLTDEERALLDDIRVLIDEDREEIRAMVADKARRARAYLKVVSDKNGIPLVAATMAARNERTATLSMPVSAKLKQRSLFDDPGTS